MGHSRRKRMSSSLLSCHHKSFFVAGWCCLATKLPVCIGDVRIQSIAFSSPMGCAPPSKRHLCMQRGSLSPMMSIRQGINDRRVVSAEMSLSASPRSSGFLGYSRTSSWLSSVEVRWRPEAIWGRGTSRKRSIRGGLRMSADVGELSILGRDALVFLAATCAVVPACIRMNVSPVLGFLGIGVALGPAGLSVIKDLNELNILGGLGISFLLFEQGLELSLDRLRALSKYAFGLGSLQVLLCTLAFALFPFVGGVDFLEIVFHSPADLVNIRRVDEAVVVGAAMSLSSSAFVLKILQMVDDSTSSMWTRSTPLCALTIQLWRVDLALSTLCAFSGGVFDHALRSKLPISFFRTKEKGQKAERFGRAVLGILLLQDIAVVPLLVLLPIIEGGRADVGLLEELAFVGAVIAKGLLGLAGILVAGRFLLRPVFDLVAGARNSETFVGLCLLVAVGVGQLTESIGLSDTLGAFVAGTLLAETNYRTQVEANIAPFRGLLLGIFFTTTGATVDPQLLFAQWPTVLGLLIGLVSFKSIIISCASLGFGLLPTEASRIGLILSGGGEFAFVVLSLSQRLGVLPEELNKLLIGVVVLSMALTPALSNLGDYASEKIAELAARQGLDQFSDLAPSLPGEGEGKGIGGSDRVVICGFGPVGQIVGSLLSAPVISSKLGADYVAFDLNPKRVRDSRAQGFPVYYGDGTVPEVLKTAGMENPKALVVTYTNSEQSIQAVQRLRQAFPGTPVFSRATNYEQYLTAQELGATAVVSDLSEISIRLGSELLESFGIARSDDVQSAKTDLRQTLVELARKGDVRGEFSARFTPAMLSVSREREKSAPNGNDQMAQLPDREMAKLGVEICPLPPAEEPDGNWSENEVLEVEGPLDDEPIGVAVTVAETIVGGVVSASMTEVLDESAEQSAAAVPVTATAAAVSNAGTIASGDTGAASHVNKL